MKRLVVDCGATKAEWCLLQAGERRNFRTRGFNLSHTPPAQLQEILDTAAAEIGAGVDEVYFFAAGCLGTPPVDLVRWFPGARVEYASDMLAAARALFGREPGVAAILGTGANTASYDGERLGWKVNCGGFIVGDEGSAAVLGKHFVADYLKDCVPGAMADDFGRRFDASYPSLVKKIYASGDAACFLGSLAPFVLSWYGRSDYARKLVDDNFRAFFERTLKRYPAGLPTGVTGSFGFACREILEKIGREYGIVFSKFLKSPMEGLAAYYAL